MKKFLKFEFWVLIIAFVVSSGIGYLPIWNHWEFISKVPGTPTQLFYNSPYSEAYNVYVRTSHDLLYLCDPYENACVKVDPNTSLPDGSFLCDEPVYTPPPAPGVVIASFAVRDCIMDGYIDVQAVGLEDGSIWTWEYVDTFTTGIGPIFFGGICALIAMILGAFFYGIRAQLRDDSPSKAKNDMKHS